MLIDAPWHCKRYLKYPKNKLLSSTSYIAYMVFGTIQRHLLQTPQQDQWYWLILKLDTVTTVQSNVTCRSGCLYL